VAAAYRTEHVAEAPRGWKVRTVKPGPRSEHEVRIAFPPGRRKKGSGRVVEILHPSSENNPTCDLSVKARKNPGELLIFGNPSKHRNAGNANHKRGCKCFACKNARGENPKRAGHATFKYQGRTFRGKTEAEAKKRALKWFNLKGGRAAKKTFAKLDRKEATRHNPKTKRSVGGGRRAAKKARRHRRNPDETKQAVKLFQSFHGKDPKNIAEKHVSAAIRKDYTALGDLEYLKVVTPLEEHAQFNFDGDGVKLASSPDGKQLYCIGGNQNLSQCLDKDSLEKDFIDLGECTEVQYLARKVHGDFEPISWFHKFGENTGALPHLAYDKLKKQIFFVGGEYFIDITAGVSPGIEN